MKENKVQIAIKTRGPKSRNNFSRKPFSCQTRDAGFSKQNYYEKIDKNHRKKYQNYKTLSARRVI